MGILRASIKAILPSRGQAIAASVPVGTAGVPQMPAYSYERFSREGYGSNELVYACVEQLATSAAEPKLCAYDTDGEKIEDHPLIALWSAPNPFLDNFTMVATIVMYQAIAGNAYVEKVRSEAGKLVELWLPRPDRVFVVPSETKRIAGYDYVLGARTYRWPETDIVHLKNRNPLAGQDAEWYGLPTLAVLAGRVDLDNWARDFVRAFFQNAGVPAGLLNIVKSVTEQEREMIRSRYRQQYGGATGWHRLLVIDGGQASYQPMALPLGESGAGMGDLDEINEARICMAFGVPPSLVATRLGMQSSSYANRTSDKENFWELTLAPLYKQIAAQLTLGFRDEYRDFAYLAFDMEDVRALSEDQDKLHERARADLAAGLVTREEARAMIGLDPEPAEVGTYYIPSLLLPTRSDEETPTDQLAPEPTPAETDAAAALEPAYGANGAATTGRGNGRAR
jgi:HK97 family phage portal protein